MAEKVVPMIHVPDVRATVDWYSGIGFTVTATYGDDGAHIGHVNHRHHFLCHGFPPAG